MAHTSRICCGGSIAHGLRTRFLGVLVRVVAVLLHHHHQVVAVLVVVRLHPRRLPVVCHGLDGGIDCGSARSRSTTSWTTARCRMTIMTKLMEMVNLTPAVTFTYAGGRVLASWPSTNRSCPTRMLQEHGRQTVAAQEP
jgi:hypothetical protein